MPDFENRIVNLITTTVENIKGAENIDQLNASFRILDGLVNQVRNSESSIPATIEEVNRRLGESALQIIQNKQKEIAANQAAAESAKTAGEEELDVTTALDAMYQKLITAKAQAQGRIGAGGTTAEETAKDTAATEENTAAKDANSQAAIKVAQGEQALIDVQNMEIRQYTELSDAEMKQIAIYVTQGKSLQEIIDLTNVWGISTGQLKQALSDLGVMIENVNAGSRQTDYNFKENIATARGLRYGGLELVGMLSMLQIAMGDQIPQAGKEMEKGLMIVTSGALMASMIGLGPVVGILVGGLLALGTASLGVPEDVANVNKELDTMAKKDELINTLSTITGTTKESAQALDDLAKKSPEVAAALEDLIKSEEKLGDANKLLDMAGQFYGALIDKIRGSADAVPILHALGEALQHAADTTVIGKALTAYDELRRQQAAANAEALLAAGAAENQKEADAERLKENQESWKANETALDSYDKALNKLGEDETKAFLAEQDAMAKAAETRKNSLADLAIQTAMQNERDAEQRNRIEDSFHDASGKAWQTYNDRIFDITRTRDEKLADEEQKYHDDVLNLAQERVKRQQDLAEKLYTIERDRIEALANLDFDTSLAMEKAKTENDKDEVEWRAMHEREVINQRADNQREDAMNRDAQDAADAAKKQKDLATQLSEREAMIERQFADETATAHRSYDEQLAAAVKTYNDQLEAQAFSEKQQAEEAKKRADDIQRTYVEQTNAARDTYNKEIDALHKRYEDERTQIKQTYQDKIDAIDQAWKDFEDKHKATMDALKEERDAAVSAAAPWGGPVIGGVTYAPAGGAGGGGASGFGGQQGLSMTIPAGFPGDTFPVRASSGEHVTITPQAGGPAQAVYITTEPLLAPLMQSLLGQMMNSGAFKEGVKLVLNDAVFQG